MGQPRSAGNDITRSLLRIDLNCPWCLRATVEALEADPHVAAVNVHSADGCLEVTHAGSVDRVLRTIDSIGHTIEVASNGEAVMAPATARIETRCTRHGAPVITPVITGQPSS